MSDPVADGTLKKILNILIFIIICAFYLLLVGCAEYPAPPSQLVKPPARLMADPGDTPGISVGDDLVGYALTLRRHDVTVTSRYRSLQRYVRTITK